MARDSNGRFVAEGSEMAREAGLTPERWVSAVSAYLRYGVFARVAQELDVTERTLYDWREKHPDFQAALDEAGRHHDTRIGQLARKALEVDLEAYLAGEPLREQVMNAKGDIATLDKPRVLNIGAVRTALTKLDPAWTHPKQQVDVTVTSVGQALDALDGQAERIEDAQVSPVRTLPSPGAEE